MSPCQQIALESLAFHLLICIAFRCDAELPMVIAIAWHSILSLHEQLLMLQSIILGMNIAIASTHQHAGTI